jgi:integrase
MPLRVIFRRALRDSLVALNPCEKLDLPANRGRRDRIISPEHAGALVAALDQPRDRALWATALYAGLRRGELLALRWGDLDLAGGTIRVERSYDLKARLFVGPKSRSGRRRVPIAGVLRDHLLDHRARLAAVEEDALVFAESDGAPFGYEAGLLRARAIWAKAELEPVGLHEARHVAASLMIAAGVNIKALSDFLGHASITITLDRYGHFLPGSIAEATGLLDAFLARSGGLTGGQDAKALQTADS